MDQLEVGEPIQIYVRKVVQEGLLSRNNFNVAYGIDNTQCKVIAGKKELYSFPCARDGIFDVDATPSIVASKWGAANFPTLMKGNNIILFISGLGSAGKTTLLDGLEAKSIAGGM
jgi:hypothetical protein